MRVGVGGCVEGPRRGVGRVEFGCGRGLQHLLESLRGRDPNLPLQEPPGTDVLAAWYRCE